MASRRYNRAYQYIYPLIALYPARVMSKLQQAGITGIYLGNKLEDTQGLHITLKKAAEVDEYFTKHYFNFKAQEHVIVLDILDKFRPVIDNFWEGKYDQMYPSLSHIPQHNGNKINMAYQVLKNTLTAKLRHKKYLVKFKYVDPKVFEDWDNFMPEQADFKPSPLEEILNAD